MNRFEASLEANRPDVDRLEARARLLFAGPALAMVLGVLAAAVPAGAESFVLRGATIHPVSSAPIESGVLVVEGGKISEVGPASASVPAGARVIEAAGKHLFPGFIQAYSQLGLTEIDSVRATVDTTEVGDNNADLRAQVAFHADSRRLLPAIGGGILTVNATLLGAGFTGLAAAMRTDGWNWEDMTLVAPTGLHLVLPGLGEADEEARSKALQPIKDLFERAVDYARARTAGLRLDRDFRLENIQEVRLGRLLLLLHADTANQVKAALAITEELEIPRWVLISTPDATYFAPQLAARKVAVILEGVLSIPTRDFEPYDFAYTAPLRLHEAGVSFSINGPGDSALVRSLPFEAGMAAGFGLPKDVALRSVTLAPAEILGIADRVGSLEAGKEATFFLSNGDPLEPATTIERVWIAGNEIDLERDAQRQLWRRYSERPKPTKR